MQWLEIVKAVADLGFIVAAAGFVLWQLYHHTLHTKKVEEDDQEQKKENQQQINQRYEMLLDNLQKRQDEFYQLIMDSNKKIEEKYDNMVNRMLDAINQPHILSKEDDARITKVDKEINMYLEKVLKKCNATRVSLVKYHNGENDMLGNSILKMSMSNERCAAGVIHIQRSCQNQLRNFSTILCQELNDKGFCFISDKKELIGIDDSLYQYMEQIGINAKYVMSIRNTETKGVIGYLSIDFANKDNINVEQVQECLNNKRIKIETLLNLSSKDGV